MTKPFKSFIKPDLKKIEAYIKKNLDPGTSIVNDESFNLYVTGGKKLRPSLALLVGKLGDKDKYNDLIKTAASLELIHMASLVHDDIIDDSETRRKRKTTFYKYGYFQAVNTGNFLISSAIEAVSHIEHQEFHDTYALAMRQIVEGELFQFDTQFDDMQTIDNYLDKIYKKTALLIVLSIKLGAFATNVDRKVLKSLIEYGYNVGMSFQIIDDYLDFTASEKILGKPKFSDLKNGHYTLPVLLLRNKDSTFRSMLKKYSKHRANSEELSKYILESNAIQESKAISNKYLDDALQNVTDIESPIKEYLVEVVEKLRDRLN